MSDNEKKDADSEAKSKDLRKKGKIVRDQQTGESFELREEEFPDRIAAGLSIIYLLIMAFFFLWQIFDFWIKNYTLIRWLGYNPVGLESSYDFHIVVYAFMGGAFGGIINGIRSFIFWHCDNQGFGRRYIWKTLSAPWLGAILALFVFTLIRSSVAILGGDFSGGEGDTNIKQILSMFALGVVSGFGSHKVFLWLDHHVNRIFKISPRLDAVELEVPDLKDMTKEEAEKKLSETGLKLSESIDTPHEEQTLYGKIIKQFPSAKSVVKKGSEVIVFVAVKPDGGKKKPGQ